MVAFGLNFRFCSSLIAPVVSEAATIDVGSARHPSQSAVDLRQNPSSTGLGRRLVGVVFVAAGARRPGGSETLGTLLATLVPRLVDSALGSESAVTIGHWGVA